MGTSIVLSISLCLSPLFRRREYCGDWKGSGSDSVGEEYFSGPFPTTNERRRKWFVGEWSLGELNSGVLLCSRMGGKSEYSSDGDSPWASGWWGETGVRTGRWELMGICLQHWDLYTLSKTIVVNESSSDMTPVEWYAVIIWSKISLMSTSALTSLMAVNVSDRNEVLIILL